MYSRAIKPGWLLALSCLIVLSLVACRNTDAVNQANTANVKQTETANIKPGGMANAKQAEAAIAKQGDVAPRVTADGRLSFVDARSLTFRTSGNVGQVNVNELDKVTKGQVLARLDTTSLDQAVKAAELALQSAEVERKQAEYSVKSAEADLNQVQNSVKSAGIDLEIADNTLRKMSYPYTISTFAFDVPAAIQFIRDAQRQLETASAGLKAGPGSANYGVALDNFRQAQDNLAKAQERLLMGQGIDAFTDPALKKLGVDFWTVRAAQLAVDKAQLAVENAQNLANKTALSVDNANAVLNKAKLAVDKAKNELDKAMTELDKAVIVAPFDGVIAKVNAKEGDLLSSGNFATTIAIEIIDPSRMELDVQVNELDISNVKLGQKVTITVDALPNQRFDGVVTSIGTLPSVESGVVSYEVKTVFNMPQNSALKTGMAATADIIGDKAK